MVKHSGPEAQHHSGADSQNPPLPRWSDYLAKLDAQARAQSAMNETAPATDETVASASQYRERAPVGDRRLTAEQRRLQRAPGTLPAELPSWSAYLARLGEQVKRTTGMRRWRRVLVKPNEGEAAYNRISRPIGDRRMGARSRRLDVAGRGAAKPSLWVGMSMGGWNYYFIAKLVLFGWSLIGFHPMLNLALAAFILFPASTRLGGLLKGVVTAALAVMLFYHDSWLPPPDRLWSQAALISSFSFSYLIELAERFVRLMVVGGLLLSWLACRLLARRLRVSVLVMVVMLGLWGGQFLAQNEVQSPAAPQLDKELRDFFIAESARSVQFAPPSVSETPFDVIFIHVCSLSWDDVRAVGLDQHPLWQRFDILLTRFNSAASYSGPAALHLMRATCGQPEHGQMYVPAANNCYLMSSLKESGFTPEIALNHDGKFDDFIGQIKTHGRLDAPPLALDGLTVAQRAFDDSPVYSDFAVLNRWLAARQQDSRARVALYYNTVSLHDGNHLPEEHAQPNTLAGYRARLSKFLDETDAFMQQLDQSGRRAVVVMVPEHGGAVRGDAMQISGLREIPTPAITLVPVGIRVLGGKLPHADMPLVADQPTSYLAVSSILQRMLAHSPFNAARVNLADYLEGLPLTRFVSQNENTTVIDFHGQYYFGHGTNDWQSLKVPALPEAVTREFVDGNSLTH